MLSQSEIEEIEVVVADSSHEKYVDTILETIAEAAKVRGTGIAKRTHEYLVTKMREAKAVIALKGDRMAGFSYIETWGNKHYVTPHTTMKRSITPSYTPTSEAREWHGASKR